MLTNDELRAMIRELIRLAELRLESRDDTCSRAAAMLRSILARMEAEDDTTVSNFLAQQYTGAA